MAKKGFTINGGGGAEEPFLWDLNYPDQVPSSQTFSLQAGANAGKYGYFLFISILPSNLLSPWHAFFFLLFIFLASRKIRAYPQVVCQLPMQLLFVHGSMSQTEVLTLTPLVLLRAPGPALTRLPGSEGGNALSCSPAGSLLIQPTGHLVSSPCYAHSLVGEVETFCRIQHFFFYFLQTRIHEESRNHWLVCDIMLLSTYRNRCTEN